MLGLSQTSASLLSKTKHSPSNKEMTLPLKDTTVPPVLMGRGAAWPAGHMESGQYFIYGS